MTTVDLPLLPLGRGVDLRSERGVECPGDLPSPADVAQAASKLGEIISAELCETVHA